MSESSGRIAYLDLLKFFAIFSVFVGHSVEQTTGEDFWDNPLWGFIYSYHMPLFMMLCGYFFGSSLRRPFLEVLRKKGIQLLLPPVAVFVVMWAAFGTTGFNPYPEIVDFSTMGFVNVLWFLKCVFLCYVIAYCFIRLTGRVWLSAISSSLLFILMPGGDVVNLNFMLPMFWTGYILSLHRVWIEAHLRWVFAVSALAFLAMLPFWSGRLTVYSVPISIVDWSTLSVDMHNLGVTMLRFAIGLAGSLTMFSLAPAAYRWLESSRLMPVLVRVGACTLGLYMAQTLLLECLIHALGVYLEPWQSFLAAPAIAVIELAICYGVVMLLRRNAFLRAAFLGETSAPRRPIPD